MDAELLAREERKVVTVLFADLVGFTARAELLDPEDVRAVLAPYHAYLRSTLERFGGTVEKFIGDAVMALFGAPIAHEDDPERAVRAALAIRDWAGESDELQVRIAVNTGEALVTLGARPDQGEGMAAGDVVNTAARMQGAAPLNGVLVGERTFRASRDAIDYRAVAQVEAKGKVHPIPVWLALDARSSLDDPVRRARLVGRTRELELLVSALGRAIEERAPQLITLVGVPGIGKSRLVQELMASVEQGSEPTVWYRGRCLSYGEGVSFWALADIVKAHAGIVEADSEGRVVEKLHDAVATLVLDRDEADWIERELRRLVGATAETNAGAGENTTAAWRRFVESLAEAAPLVLVFEDIHWADDGLLDFIDELVDWVREVPLLVLATTRPELLERRPGWGGGKANAATISLSPLGEADTTQLISALLGRVQPADDQQELLARAGGNPLFAEQYVRMLGEVAHLHDVDAPESVQGIIRARLDALPSSEKDLLQDAAVFGKEFWPEAVAAIAGLGAAETVLALRPLERKGFVQRERRPAGAGDVQYAFAHALLREAAYRQVPRRLRGEKHRRAAQWIETLGRPDDYAETIAYHYRQALALARATQTNDPALVEPTRRALRKAAERAASLSAYASSVEFFGEALELTPYDATGRPEMLLGRARALFHVDGTGLNLLTEALDAFQSAGDNERAAQAATAAARLKWFEGDRPATDEFITRALELVANRPSSPAKAEALAAQSGYHMLAGEFEASVHVGAEALSLAEELGLSTDRARVHIVVGCSRCCLGDVEGLSEIKDGVAIGRSAGTFDIVAVGYGNLASELFFFGRLAEANHAWEHEREVSERYGFIRHRRSTRTTDAGRALAAGRWSDALRLADDIVAQADAGVRDYEHPTALSLRAFVRFARGDVAGAEADSKRAVKLARSSDAQAQSQAFSTRALVAIAVGRRDEGWALASDLATIGPVLLPALCFPFPTLAEVAWVFHDLGRAKELVTVLDATPIDSPWNDAARAIADGDPAGGADIIDAMGHSASAAYARLRAAEAFAADGRQPEAERQLTLAVPFYHEVGALTFLQKAASLTTESA
jgi:class 3 adenylate cyclase